MTDVQVVRLNAEMAVLKDQITLLKQQVRILQEQTVANQPKIKARSTFALKGSLCGIP